MGGAGAQSTIGTVRWPESCARPGERRVLLAIGPDGGWDEPFELDLFQRNGFVPVCMAGGIGTLRTDIALATLVARAHERLEAEDRSLVREAASGAARSA